MFLDSGWISETVQDYLCGELSETEFFRQLESIQTMERQLTNGGYLLVKLFFHIDAKQQHDRLYKLASHRDTSWRASEADWRQNKDYDRYLDCFDRCLEATDTPWAPWKVIDISHKVSAQLQAAEWLYQQICAALESRPETCMPEYHWPLEPSPLLRRKRVAARWLRQNLGLEACAYRPTFAMLRSMFRWSREYENGQDGVRERAAQFPEKLTVLRSKKDIRRWMRDLEQ